MTNEEAINVLTLHKENWERLIREHIAEKQEGNEMVEALGKAIEALKIANGTPISETDRRNIELVANVFVAIADHVNAIRDEEEADNEQ